MYWSQFNYLEFQLPHDCVSDLSGSGDCTQSCEYWQTELNLNLNRTAMINELKEWSDDDLELRCIWLAAEIWSIQVTM